MHSWKFWGRQPTIWCSKQQLEKLHYTHHRDHMDHPHLHVTSRKFLIWMIYGGNVPFTLNGMSWASRIHDFGERIFGDPIFVLPLKGNLFVAQDQHVLYTFHEWRGRQCGVVYFSYHVHPFSTPSLQELRVEEIHHEFPSWKATNFSWIIAWEGESFIGDEVLRDYPPSYLE